VATTNIPATRKHNSILKALGIFGRPSWLSYGLSLPKEKPLNTIRTALIALLCLYSHTLLADPASKQAVPSSRKPDAQAKRGAAWPQEPTAVIGVKLGLPIEESNLISCDVLEKDPTAAARPCLAYLSPNSRKEIQELRYHGISQVSRATVNMDNGMVKDLTLSLASKDFDAMAAILRERYGPPAKVTNSTVTTKTGAKFDQAILSWKGKVNSIQLVQRVYTINDAAVIFYSNRSLEKSKEADEQAAKEAAAKF
jgi:hypothetical protein